MRKVALLSDEDRGELFIATSALVGIRPEAVEKDFCQSIRFPFNESLITHSSSGNL